MTARRHDRRAQVTERRLAGAGRELQGTAVELALAAPFLTPRDLRRWRARIAGWHRVAVQDAALLARLDAMLARYTPEAGGRAGARRSA